MRYIRPFSGMTILDIGCGPADILDYLPDVEYWGFDISEAYIGQAQKKFKDRGYFYCKELCADDLDKMPPFDVVLAIGLLHHLDNQIALNTLGIAHQSLKKGGRLLTVDPCLDPSQNSTARFLVHNDRGQNVRDKSGYESLALNVFSETKANVKHQVLIPYTHCIMECKKHESL